VSRHALIISLTPVADEPRVRRQSQALHDAGWRVSVAGLRGLGQVPGFWRFVELSYLGPAIWEQMGLTHRGVWWGIRARRWNIANRYLSRISPAAAERAYWSVNNYPGIYEQLAYVEPGDYDLILCHDWFTAPIAERLADKLGVPYSVDAHEYSTGQYMTDRRWRRRERPWIDAVQKQSLPQAAAVTTVCDGIADRLHADYALPERPIVLRSVAQYRELPLRATGERVTVLFHGVLAPERGLEEVIASVPRWRPEFHLILRGGGADPYVAGLRSLAERMGASDRVTIEGPVPATEMIERANADADVGYCVPPELSPQKRFALPNKFFEYVTAGLALCVTDLPEMARLVHEHELGVLVPDATPDQIAKVINGLDREAIDNFKQRSLEAARVLDWNLEKEVMLGLYDRLAPSAGVGRQQPSATVVGSTSGSQPGS
jgi:glycosyltransferase involved in cell wall biosynthesis